MSCQLITGHSQWNKNESTGSKRLQTETSTQEEYNFDISVFDLLLKKNTMSFPWDVACTEICITVLLWREHIDICINNTSTHGQLTAYAGSYW